MLSRGHWWHALHPERRRDAQLYWRARPWRGPCPHWSDELVRSVDARIASRPDRLSHDGGHHRDAIATTARWRAGHGWSPGLAPLDRALSSAFDFAVESEEPLG